VPETAAVFDNQTLFAQGHDDCGGELLAQSREAGAAIGFIAQGFHARGL